MKSRFLTSLLCLVAMNISYAASCDLDVHQMSAQIAKYGSITTPDKLYRFTSVMNPVETGSITCQAFAYNDSMGSGCTIAWTKGDWGNTFHC